MQSAWTLAAAATLLVPRAAATAPPDPRHHVVLWTFDDDSTRPRFVGAVKALGADAVSASPGSDPSALAGSGLTWYEDHASGKGTLGLRESDWKPAWDKAWEARKTDWPDAAARTRPLCPRDPGVLKGLEERTLVAAKRAAGGAFAISLEDEPSMTVRANPIDWCLCGRCEAAFRAAMRLEYGDVKALNASWSTAYDAWDEVRPWTTAAAKARIKGVDPDEWNLAPWMDTRAFQDRTFADLLAHLRDVAGRAAPGVPCGVTGTQAPSAFGGWDYGLLRNSMSFVEPYDIGLSLPICRDLFPKGTVIAQTVFPAENDDILPRWRLWRGVARGANTTIVWSSHDALTREGPCGVSPYGASLAADLKLLSAEDGLGARLARATPHDGGVVVLYSQASVAVRWMLDSREDGDTWPRRFGSYEAANSTSIAARDAAWRAVCDRGARFMDVRDLASPATRAGMSGVVLLAPDLIALSRAERDGLKALLRADVANASRLHALGPIGEFDELGRATRAFPKDGVVFDPAFAAAGRMRFLGKRTPVRATVTRADRGAPPSVEMSFWEEGGAVLVVAVPAWAATTDDAGNATASIPKTDLAYQFEVGGEAPHEVRDLKSGKELGRVATWISTSDAAGGLVFEIR